jgi:putative ABC transport system permease protein
MFVTESAIMGFIGGLVGIFLGFIASGIVSELGTRLIATGGDAGGFSTLISPELVAFAIGFSIIIGAISGLLPARRASKLQPVEALRYE